jgi:hypothetical protein
MEEVFVLFSPWTVWGALSPNVSGKLIQFCFNLTDRSLSTRQVERMYIRDGSTTMQILLLTGMTLWWEWWLSDGTSRVMWIIYQNMAHHSLTTYYMVLSEVRVEIGRYLYSRATFYSKISRFPFLPLLNSQWSVPNLIIIVCILGILYKVK